MVLFIIGIFITLLIELCIVTYAQKYCAIDIRKVTMEPKVQHKFNDPWRIGDYKYFVEPGI